MTPPITVIDKATCTRLAELTRETMAAHAAGLGLTIKGHNSTYDDLTATVKITFVVDNGESHPVEAEAYRRMADSPVVWEIEPDDLGKTITLSGNREMIIAGWRSRARKNNILLDDPNNGKTYTTSDSVVARFFGRKQNVEVVTDIGSLFEKTP